MKKQVALRGFTLVELSIVIVIIGFLVAGIAVGANMIKQSQIRSVITDLQSYQSAYNSFVAKYNAVPGDMLTASAFWPTLAVCATTATTDCNGNGDGIIQTTEVIPSDEVRPALKVLSLSGFISSGIQVVPAQGATTALSPGLNAPSSKLTGTGYFIAQGITPSNTSATMPTSTATGFFTAATNAVFFGKEDSAKIDNLVFSALAPQDAYGVDQKIDDGASSGTNLTGANSGRLMAIDGADVASGQCATTGVYLVTNTSEGCILGMALN
ncbi:MAG: type II secretion system protein [Rickettsiales bacterium]